MTKTNAPTVRRLALFAPRSAAEAALPLIPAMGPELAAGFYRAMLSDALDAGRAARVDERWLYWNGENADSDAEDGLDLRGFKTCGQSGGSAGARVSAAFQELLRDPGDRAVITIADCPWVSAGVIEAAFDALARAQAVLGPNRNGGAVLVGLATPRPALFADAWGSDRAIAATIERARQERLSFECLEPLGEVDTPHDVVELVRAMLARPGSSPRRTRETLAAAGLLPAP